jgi:cytochrome c-type biogenesis protein
MLKDISLPAPLRSMSTGQRLLVGVALILLVILVVGTLNQAGEPDDFAFGIQAHPFGVLAILAFGGGLLSFVSPCTLPVLTAYFAFAFQSGRKQIASNTLAFMLGLGTTFSLLGAVGFALGRVLRQNEGLLVLLGGAFILFFGVMSLLGKGFGGIQQPGSAQPYNTTLRGSYLFGLSFAVGWSSCVGPILGAVFTLAAQTASVWNGMMLLFIYTLGLGLPLAIVSTFFGRMPRTSLIWRLLKGKGWDWNTHSLVVALIWALAIWGALSAFARYAIREFKLLEGFEFGATQAVLLLVPVLIGVLLWVITGSEKRRITLHLHSTQLLSGGLFILIGALMLAGKLATFNSLIPTDLAVWFIDIEEKFLALFN